MVRVRVDELGGFLPGRDVIPIGTEDVHSTEDARTGRAQSNSGLEASICHAHWGRP